MPLTLAQTKVLQSPQVRQRLTAKAADFAYVDQLIKDVGVTCTRLPAVWDRIFYGLTVDQAKWLNATYPGFNFTSADASKPPPASIAPRSVVNRAINVLQSYKKSP
jgi:hypothetical protein